MTKVRVALLFGGASSEHSVSCVTAKGVASSIDASRFDVIPIGITKSGEFFLTQIRQDWELSHNPEVNTTPSPIRWEMGRRDASVFEGGQWRELKIDVVFPLLHGVNGEDGSVQGLLQLVGLPYVGNGVLASALAMDKVLAKSVFRDAGVPVAESRVVTQQQWLNDPESTLERLRDFGPYPLFVKPSRSGSSVGVSMVKSPTELPAAIASALEHDNHVLVEQRLIGREVECSVLQGRAGAPHRVSLAGEIVVHGRDFYDYEAKYLDAAAAELRVPVELAPHELHQMQALARKAFDALGCAGLARTDFFLTEQGFVLTEVNTMPGFTPISMYPKLWQSSGLGYSELITELIDLALEAGVSPR